MAVLARLKVWAEPLLLLTINLAFLPFVLFKHPLLLVTSPSTFKAKWFSTFWHFLGPKMAASPAQVDHIDSLLTRAHGTVLEFGPGTGDQMFHFKPVADQINRIYGAEPNVFLHEKLYRKAKEAGLGGKYQVLAAGAEPNSLLPALKRAGVIPPNTLSLPDEGVFDTIIAIKSMCSASQHEMPSTMAICQALLKPGGEFLFFEHVSNNTDQLTQTLASMMNVVWTRVMGNCHLDGKVDRVVLGMGGWARKDILTTDEYQEYSVLRYVKGICIKA